MGVVVVDDNLTAGEQIKSATTGDGVIGIRRILENERADVCVGTDRDGRSGVERSRASEVAESSDAAGGHITTDPVCTCAPSPVAVHVPIGSGDGGKDLVVTGTDIAAGNGSGTSPAGEVDAGDNGGPGGAVDDELLGAVASEGTGPVSDGESAGEGAEAGDGAVDTVEAEETAVVEVVDGGVGGLGELAEGGVE